LARIANSELGKFRLKFSRFTNCDVTSLSLNTVACIIKKWVEPSPPTADDLHTSTPQFLTSYNFRRQFKIQELGKSIRVTKLKF